LPFGFEVSWLPVPGLQIGGRVGAAYYLGYYADTSGEDYIFALNFMAGPRIAYSFIIGQGFSLTLESSWMFSTRSTSTQKDDSNGYVLGTSTLPAFNTLLMNVGIGYWF